MILALLLIGSLTGGSQTATGGVHVIGEEGFQERDFIEEYEGWHSDLQEKILKAPLIMQQLGVDRGQAPPWLHCMVRQDLTSRTWDLFLDGSVLACNLTMINQVGKQDGLEVAGHSFQPVYLGGVSVEKEGRLFVDSSSNGMSDVSEMTCGFGPYIDDRCNDAGEISAFERFLTGELDWSIVTSGSEAARKNFCVDAFTGKTCISVVKRSRNQASKLP